MQVQKLSDRSASLDNNGFQKLLNLLSTNEELAKKIANDIEENPRETIKRYFRLSTLQRNAIDNTPDSELKLRAAGLIVALRNGIFEGITYDPGKQNEELQADLMRVTVECICSITINF